MDFSKLKELAKTLGGILVMNGNEPELVVMPYEKFVHMEKATPVPVFSSSGGGGDEEQLIDALNKEILALKEEIRQKETAELVSAPEGLAP